ncbi:hypothetical protein FISHEDRAFT_57787 [Fistulina hepatica ATCC 64428]|uniref:ERCC4 domain-containing protein n=1 Tax=Fistulina hepatica ATCC 64428 TaxID=1128425 RepID=A0A0D7AIB6_9AGAR|nr:hypothetical protein FISHEDRAFT_57787 [Fistulina hepatica ATCC 64428]
MSALLPFQTSILERVHDPSTSELLLLARGLGLRKLICTLLRIYDSPRNLILLVNATQEEEAEIGEELGIMGCRKPGLRVVGYEVGSKERHELYKQGGLISVTSRILVVDMLQHPTPNINIERITGMIVVHAERVIPGSLESFFVRLYRERNTEGFLKAFTDQPEHITSGLSPLKSIMKELQLRSVLMFHVDIKKSLERRRADVVELSQPLTEPMSEIHNAILQCMNTTLSELKRSNTSLDLDDFTVENVYFRSFDVIVRKQLDSVWHKVGPRTKQLVNDLGTLRRLLQYLLSYDALHFHAYLESLVEANSISASGAVRQHQSPWLLTDTANTIFTAAKRRCYLMTAPAPERVPDDDEDAWAALDELEDTVGTQPPPKGERPRWLPPGMEPVLEELPKWSLVGEVLQEIEEEIIRLDMDPKTRRAPGSNVVLVMASSTQTCTTLSEYLESMDQDAPRGRRGRAMMMRKLGTYLWWKGRLSNKERNEAGTPTSSVPNCTDNGREGNTGISEALQKKDRERQARSAQRRRMRGGKVSQPVTRPEPESDVHTTMRQEADTFAAFLDSASQQDIEMTLLDTDDGDLTLLDLESTEFTSEFDANYGLVTPEQTVIVRPYTDDTDDRLLAEIEPRFIIMFEPNMEFVRRIEVYKSSHPGLAVRVYHMVYTNSCEEHKYLAGIRKEKDSFERLIKERGSMLIPIFDNKAKKPGEDAIIKTISSRLAGGRREISQVQAQVIVDVREFRSTLPSLLHASNLLVIPVTLTVGDYILTPDICVERKSLPDLVSSFNSGRLYTQCELMSVHYKHPILLIEFEEDKAFTLDTVADFKSHAKPTKKYPLKKVSSKDQDDPSVGPSIQSKIVLLTLTFPRVRIIWSSSPHATAEIFNDLKKNNVEPDAARAISVGAEEDPEAGAGINAAAEDLLRTLPGITAKNLKYVMSKIRNVRELCEMDLTHVQEMLGAEPGKLCWEFMHNGDDRRTLQTKTRAAP